MQFALTDLRDSMNTEFWTLDAITKRIMRITNLKKEVLPSDGRPVVEREGTEMAEEDGRADASDADELVGDGAGAVSVAVAVAIEGLEEKVGAAPSESSPAGEVAAGKEWVLRVEPVDCLNVLRNRHLPPIIN